MSVGFLLFLVYHKTLNCESVFVILQSSQYFFVFLLFSQSILTFTHISIKIMLSLKANKLFTTATTFIGKGLLWCSN